MVATLVITGESTVASLLNRTAIQQAEMFKVKLFFLDELVQLVVCFAVRHGPYQHWVSTTERLITRSFICFILSAAFALIISLHLYSTNKCSINKVCSFENFIF